MLHLASDRTTAYFPEKLLSIPPAPEVLLQKAVLLAVGQVIRLFETIFHSHASSCGHF